MTAKKRWPNDAENARRESISLAVVVTRHVSTMLDQLENGKSISSLELSIRLARINSAASEIKVKLLEAGPQKFLD
jgi:hypothetical protein